MEKIAPGPLQKIDIEHISTLHQHSEQFIFIVYPSQGLPNYIKIKVLNTWFYLI